MDLLTVVMHEMGHVLGFADLNPGVSVHSVMIGTLDTGVRHLPGNGTSKHQAPNDQIALVAMESRSDSLFAGMKLPQNSWLMGYLLNAAENGYNAFGVNDDIRIVLDEKDKKNTKPRRMYGQGSQP